MTSPSARSCPRCGARLDAAGKCGACSARAAARGKAPALPELPALEGEPELSSLDGLPELPPLDSDADPELGAGEAAQAAPVWRATPQEVYGCQPGELERLIQGVSGEDAQDAPAREPVWNADQLAERAGFGDAPDGRVAAIGYVVRVIQRRRALRDEVAAAQRAATDARANGRAALAELGEAIFARRAEAGRGSLAARIDAAAKALSVVQEREDAQAALGDQAAQEFERLQAAIEAAERAAEPYRVRKAEVDQKVARARREAERAGALHKRAEIEIRAAQSAAVPDAARIERAQADREARAGELGYAQSALTAVQAELADAQADLDEQLAKVAVHQGALKAVVEEQARKAGAAQSAIGDAAAVRRDTLCELATTALRQNLAPKAQAAVAIEALRSARAASDDAALLAAADAAYDKDGYRMGVTTAAAAAAVLVLILAWLVA